MFGQSRVLHVGAPISLDVESRFAKDLKAQTVRQQHVVGIDKTPVVEQQNRPVGEARKIARYCAGRTHGVVQKACPLFLSPG